MKRSRVERQTRDLEAQIARLAKLNAQRVPAAQAETERECRAAELEIRMGMAPVEVEMSIEQDRRGREEKLEELRSEAAALEGYKEELKHKEALARDRFIGKNAAVGLGGKQEDTHSRAQQQAG